MSTLSKIEYAGRVFYYDPRGQQLVTTGHVQKHDLLLLTADSDIVCYPAFWDDINRPVAEFPLGVLRPITKAPQKSTLERFVDYLDTRYPNDPSPLVGCVLCGAVGILIFVLVVLLFSI